MHHHVLGLPTRSPGAAWTREMALHLFHRKSPRKTREHGLRVNGHDMAETRNNPWATPDSFKTCKKSSGNKSQHRAVNAHPSRPPKCQIKRPLTTPPRMMSKVARAGARPGKSHGIASAWTLDAGGGVRKSTPLGPTS